MFKDGRFGNACRLRDLFGRRSAKTFFGKKTHCDLQKLLAAFIARHSARAAFEDVVYQ